MTTRTLFVLFCAIPALFFLTGSPSLQALALLWPVLWIGLLTVAFAARYILDHAAPIRSVSDDPFHISQIVTGQPGKFIKGFFSPQRNIGDTNTNFLDTAAYSPSGKTIA
jgi:hypothetical protein